MVGRVCFGTCLCVPKLDPKGGCVPKIGPRARKLSWEAERNRVRKVANLRERFWVDKLRSLWPKGWNSQYPGKPAAPGRQPQRASQAARQPDSQQPAKDLQAAALAIDQGLVDPAAAQAWLAGASREDLSEILDGLQTGIPASAQTAQTTAITAEIREILRKRKKEKKCRDFVRFLYGNRLAGALNLPALFKDPEVYRLHPEPDVAAAIMVVHRFAPQIGHDLFNYHKWAARPALWHGVPEQCPCHTQTLPGVALVEGHVLSTDPSHLKSPYLRDILGKGKKYRLEQPLGSVLARLGEGLQQYVDYKMKSTRGDQAYEAALRKWMEALMKKAQARLQAAARETRPMPEGYPGLKEQMRAAQNALVFGPEDRAPHAFFYACGRYYASKLHYRLLDSGAFTQEARGRPEVLAEIGEFNDSLSLVHHPRVPYLYGAWKGKEEAYRWIAGTSWEQDEKGDPKDTDKEEQKGPPNNALSEVASVMVRVMQQVLQALRTKDVERRGKGLPPRYWVVEDIDEFA